jgi:hypothetical protein
MQLTKKFVVDLLRRTGYLEAADEAMRVLPDQIDLDQLTGWAASYGITRDELMSRMGGSP